MTREFDVVLNYRSNDMISLFYIFLTINYIFFSYFQILEQFFSLSYMLLYVHIDLSQYFGMVCRPWNSPAWLHYYTCPWIIYYLSFIVVVLWKDPVQCFSFQVLIEQLFIQWKLFWCVSIATNVVLKHTREHTNYVNFCVTTTS